MTKLPIIIIAQMLASHIEVAEFYTQIVQFHGEFDNEYWHGQKTLKIYFKE